MIRRKTTYNLLQIVIITILFLLVSCGGNRVVDSRISSADSLMDACQDSAQTALAMLDSLKAQKPDMSKAQQMHFDLIYAKAMNKKCLPKKHPMIWAPIAHSTGNECPSFGLSMPDTWSSHAHLMGMAGPLNGLWQTILCAFAPNSTCQSFLLFLVCVDMLYILE